MIGNGLKHIMDRDVWIVGQRGKDGPNVIKKQNSVDMNKARTTFFSELNPQMLERETSHDVTVKTIHLLLQREMLRMMNESGSVT